MSEENEVKEAKLSIGFFSLKFESGCTTCALYAASYIADGGDGPHVTVIEPKLSYRPVFRNIDELDRYRDGVTVYPGWEPGDDTGEEDVVIYDFGMVGSTFKFPKLDRLFLCSGTTQDDWDAIHEFVPLGDTRSYTILLKNCSHEEIRHFKELQSSVFMLELTQNKCPITLADIICMMLPKVHLKIPQNNRLIRTDDWDMEYHDPDDLNKSKSSSGPKIFGMLSGGAKVLAQAVGLDKSSEDDEGEKKSLLGGLFGKKKKGKDGGVAAELEGKDKAPDTIEIGSSDEKTDKGLASGGTLDDVIAKETKEEKAERLKREKEEKASAAAEKARLAEEKKAEAQRAIEEKKAEAQRLKEEAERKKAEEAERKKQAAEEAKAAAEAKVREAEEKKRQAQEAKEAKARAIQEAKEAKAREAEEKRQAAERAKAEEAERRKAAIEEKKLLAEQKRKELEEAKRLAEQKKLEEAAKREEAIRLKKEELEAQRAEEAARKAAEEEARRQQKELEEAERARIAAEQQLVKEEEDRRRKEQQEENARRRQEEAEERRRQLEDEKASKDAARQQRIEDKKRELEEKKRAAEERKREEEERRALLLEEKRAEAEAKKIELEAQRAAAEAENAAKEEAARTALELKKIEDEARRQEEIERKRKEAEEAAIAKALAKEQKAAEAERKRLDAEAARQLEKERKLAEIEEKKRQAEIRKQEALKRKEEEERRKAEEAEIRAAEEELRRIEAEAAAAEKAAQREAAAADEAARAASKPIPDIESDKGSGKKPLFGFAGESASSGSSFGGGRGYLGHITVFVTALRHGVGSSYTAGSIGTYFTSTGSTVCLCHKPGTNFPQDRYMAEYTGASSFEDAFQAKTVVFDRGIIGELKQHELAELKKADIKILVCGDEEADVSKLAKFVHQMGPAAKDWLYVFNLTKNKKTQRKMEEYMQEYRILFLPLHDYNALPKAVQTSWAKAAKQVK